MRMTTYYTIHSQSQGTLSFYPRVEDVKRLHITQIRDIILNGHNIFSVFAILLRFSFATSKTEHFFKEFRK